MRIQRLHLEPYGGGARDGAGPTAQLQPVCDDLHQGSHQRHSPAPATLRVVAAGQRERGAGPQRGRRLRTNVGACTRAPEFHHTNERTLVEQVGSLDT